MRPKDGPCASAERRAARLDVLYPQPKLPPLHSLDLVREVVLYGLLGLDTLLFWRRLLTD
jgi:hypothetical protein